MSDPAIADRGQETLPDIESTRASSIRSVVVSELILLPLSLAALLGIWVGVIAVFDLHPFFAKSPASVWGWMFTDENAAEHRELLRSELWVTLRDTLVGYVTGTVLGAGLAVAFYVNRTLKAAVTPWVIFLQSVPLIVFMAIVVLVIGRGLLAVVFVGGLITFFPTFIYTSAGLASAPAESCDVIRSYGGSEYTILWRVRIAYGLPFLFAAAKLAVPNALGGAILVEFLATGEGLGYLLTAFQAFPDSYNVLWANVVAITTLAVGIYVVVSIAENILTRRFGTRNRRT